MSMECVRLFFVLVMLWGVSSSSAVFCQAQAEGSGKNQIKIELPTGGTRVLELGAVTDTKISETTSNTITQRTDIDPVGGVVYVYCTFEAPKANPIALGTGLRNITLGAKSGDTFTPIARFGLADHKNVWSDPEKTLVSPWANDGRIDYFGGYCVPKVLCDFKLKLDLPRQRMSAFVAQRGSDRWFILAEGVPLINSVKAINEVRIEQSPGAAGISGLRIQKKQWADGERIRPNPLAKPNRVVKQNAGFTFQPMRSVWQTPGRHVTIQRNPPRWYGFPDVVQTGPTSLVVCYSDGVGHGGYGGLFVKHSNDLGKTWGEQIMVHPSLVNCPRIQKLKDGSLLLLADIQVDLSVVMYDSHDGGHTWTNQRWLKAVEAGGTLALVPSHVLEMPDGSWLLFASSLHPQRGETWLREWLETYISHDRGRTWKLYVDPAKTYPPRTLSEPDVRLLPDGRLFMVVRETRGDGWPATKAFSSDGGKTWDWQFLPFNICGRVCWGFLKDGRAMATFRSHASAGGVLMAWIGDPSDTTQYKTAGAHINDMHSVGLKDGALHIDSDGACGQFTQYVLRPFYTEDTALDLTFEVKVAENTGRAATFSIPFVGNLRLYPDHVEFAHNASLSFPVKAGQFHTYRVVSSGGHARIFLDGKPALETSDLNPLPCKVSGLFPDTDTKQSGHYFAFGNEQMWEVSACNLGCIGVWPQYVPQTTTGYSIWKRVEVHQDDPKFGKYDMTWSAKDSFPDQYQLDHMIEVEASVLGADQGYPGWTQLDDGRIFVVNYTDDTAPSFSPLYGMSWIRGTYLLPSDLPPVNPGGK